MQRIATSWFIRDTLADGITWITEPHVHPLIRCNIWHVRGRDSDLLVDTGLGVASLRDAIADLTDKPLTAVASHVHYDHVGGLHEFADARIHAAEAAQMADYREFHWLTTAAFPQAILDGLASSGYVIDTEYLIDALPHAGFDPHTYSVPSTPARSLQEGEVLDLGNRQFEVLHLPGHSPGSIGLWEARSGTLFAGDAIYDGPLLDELPDSNIPAYINTMKRLRQLPVQIVHAGHEPSFGRTRLVELVDAYLAWRDPD